jgi:hypothetical protein
VRAERELGLMLKIFFADQDGKADALAALGQIRQWAQDRHAENVAIARSYLAGRSRTDGS